jgi:hypothetical protein
MNMSRIALLALLAIGCGSNASFQAPVDASPFDTSPTAVDAATDAGVDAGTATDTGQVVDTGVDVGAVDTGVDAGPVDTGVDVPAADTGPVPCGDGGLMCPGLVGCDMVMSDPAHCGSCDNHCPAGDICFRGSCETSP